MTELPPCRRNRTLSSPITGSALIGKAAQGLGWTPNGRPYAITWRALAGRTAEFVEVESGKRNSRPELQKALSACRRHKARLIIAKLDRLSRNVAFIATMMDAGVEFVACDNPHATRLTLHILAAVAEHEREMIAARTKAALQAAKARGVRLGRNGAEYLAPSNKAAAIERARTLAPVLQAFADAGMSARQIAAELTVRHTASPRRSLASSDSNAIARRAVDRGPRVSRRPISRNATA